MKIKSEQEMIEAGKAMAANVQGVIELVGDVGAGKTTFVRGLAEGLGIKDSVTSPSFTISKSYACPNGRTLMHYDFYRLNEPGLMLDELEESLKNENNIIVIEWSDSIKELLPKKHIIINIKYNDDDSRELEVLR
jgi:tRNA threonylcarbamoyladenosine biosynthesis protein TsaE